MDSVWPSAKLLKPYSQMTSLYLYFHLLHSILSLKCNVYTLYYVAAHVPDFEYLMVGSSLLYYVF